jgi:hypothetical protein
MQLRHELKQAKEIVPSIAPLDAVSRLGRDDVVFVDVRDLFELEGRHQSLVLFTSREDQQSLRLTLKVQPRRGNLAGKPFYRFLRIWYAVIASESDDVEDEY